MEEELRLGRRTSEATGACLVRQRFTSREHSPVRQYGFLSRLPRYSETPWNLIGPDERML
jgi:hypothetical protein